ncbi:MAG: DUF2279 domain-containing protein [Bacteroidota bacterium]
MRRALLVLLAVPLLARAQEPPLQIPPNTMPSPDPGSGRKIASTAMVGAIFAANLVDAYFTWWKDAQKPFSFFSEDWLNGPHLGIDKPGHFYGAYSIFKITRTILLWGGHDRSTAFWWATGLSLFNGLEVEIGDGFSPYGFDVEDLLFDFAGVGYAMLQSEIPYLENFNFKFSYWSEKGVKTPAAFVEDYDALTIWLSFNMHNLLPEPVAGVWPKWLNLAVGYGVDDRVTRREFLIGLDLNFEGFETESQDVLLLERIGNVWHAPAPAVKFTTGRGPRWYLAQTR